MSFAEYLEYEKRSQVRHEFVAGQLFLLAGGSDTHNRLALRIATLLEAASRESGCRVYLLDMLVRTPDDVGYYPDVFVTCQPDEDPYVKRHPCLIVEILSESTEAIDRGEKFRNYRRIDALQAYLLVAQDAKRVEVFCREVDGAWRYAELGEGEGLTLPCVGVRLEPKVIYAEL